MKIFTRLRIMVCALMVWAPVAAADESPTVVKYLGYGGTLYKMCDAFSGTGICTRNGDEVVLDTAGFRSLAIDFSQSTTTFTCELVGNNVGYDADNDGTTLNSTSFSGSQYVITLTDTPRFVWVTCSANVGDAVTATILARRY